MEYSKINQRVYWIDIAKVILIYLMVVCHLGVSDAPDTIITSFHMSAFFMISGILHREGEWLQSMKKTTKRLLIPVLFFNILGYIIWYCHNYDLTFSIKEYITKPILGIVLFNPMARPMCMPMWFCIALFFAKAMALLCKALWHYYALTICCIAIGLVLANITIGGGNFIGRIFFGCMFYTIGYLLRNLVKQLISLSVWKRTVFMIICFCILMVTALYNGRPSWLNFEFGKFTLLFFVTSLLGACVTFILSSFIGTKGIQLVTYLSKNTMTILGVHLSLFSLVPVINSFLGGLLVLFYCLPIIYVFNKACPSLIGNK